MVEKSGPSSNVGWRFAAGVVLIVGGYIAWTFIPVVVATDLSTGAKSVLTALLGATPFMTKIVAVAIMGKPAYDLFKRWPPNSYGPQLLLPGKIPTPAPNSDTLTSVRAPSTHPSIGRPSAAESAEVLAWIEADPPRPAARPRAEAVALRSMRLARVPHDVEPTALSICEELHHVRHLSVQVDGNDHPGPWRHGGRYGACPSYPT